MEYKKSFNFFYPHKPNIILFRTFITEYGQNENYLSCLPDHS